MKLRSKLAFITAVLLLLSWLIASAPLALAQGPTVLTGFSVNDINIRTGPGQSAGSVGILPAREKVTAIGRNDGNNWIQIQFGATTGWVAKWVTVYSGDTALLPIASSVNPQLVGGSGPLDLTSPFNVNIRSAPNVKAGLLETIPFGDQAEAFGRTDTSSWINVRYNGREGWVANWLVILNSDFNVLPVTSGETTAPPTGQVTGTPPVAGTPVGTPLPGPVTPPPPPPDGAITVKTPSKANIRTAPSVDALIIGGLSFTDTGFAVGQNASHNWLQVVNGGTEGWVARWVVITSDDTIGLPITSDSNEVLPVPGGVGILGKGMYDIFIRSGPGVNYGSLAALPAYTNVPLVARTQDNNWVKVSFQNTTGWVAAWLMACSGDYSNLTVENPTQ